MRHSFWAFMGWVSIAIISIADRLLRDAIKTSEYFFGSFFVSSNEHIETRFLGWWPGTIVTIPVGVLLFGIAVALVFFLCRGKLQWHDPRTLAVVTILFSAVNNLLDRIRSGGVWDYWTLATAWGGLSFNIADVMIMVAIVYLFLLSFRHSELEIRN